MAKAIDWDAELKRRGWRWLSRPQCWFYCIWDDMDNMKSLNCITYSTSDGWQITAKSTCAECNHLGVSIPGPKTVKQLDALLKMLGDGNNE